jgi:hypothetical protein
MNYKFKSDSQIRAEKNERQALKESENKKLKESTFTVATIDDALATIQECMKLIAYKKRNPLAFTDLIGSAIIGGMDKLSSDLARDDTEKTASISDRLKKRLIMLLRGSVL